jgi:PAS domain S-box-containing protein
LHELASSPSTAADALALLHELQVHQVELDLQAEELRASRAELEEVLRRQIQLYESAPVGYFTIDLGGALRELNLAGAALLGCDRDALLGQPLSGFLAPHSTRALQDLLASVSEGHRGEACELQLMPRGGGSRKVYATVDADPAGSAFLVALMDAEAGDRAQ